MIDPLASLPPTTRRRRRLLTALVAALIVVSACTGSDSTSSTSVTELAPPDGEASDAEQPTETQPTDAAIDPRFDIDAVLAADPNCVDPVVGEPLRIGYAADLSELGGPADGPGSQAAAHLANLINCSGGLDGRPVEVVVQDISGDALATRSAMIDLLSSDVHVLLGPPFPDPGFRVLQVTDGDYAVIFTGSTEPALGDNSSLSYLVAFNDTQGATVAAQFALTKGWARAITFSSPGPYFGYNTLVFKGVYEANGGEVIGDYLFVPGETSDFSDVIPDIVADPPDVIYTPMFAGQLVALRQQLEAAGVQVEYLQSDAFEATGGYTLAGIEGVYHVTHAFPDEGSRIVALNDSLTAATGSPSDAPSMVALAGDAVAVIADAYLRTGTTDPRALGLAIANAQGVEGVTGTLSYNGSGTPTKPIYIHQVVNGQAALAATIGS